MTFKTLEFTAISSRHNTRFIIDIYQIQSEIQVLLVSITIYIKKKSTHEQIWKKIIPLKREKRHHIA